VLLDCSESNTKAVRSVSFCFWPARDDVELEDVLRWLWHQLLLFVPFLSIVQIHSDNSAYFISGSVEGICVSVYWLVFVQNYSKSSGQ